MKAQEVFLITGAASGIGRALVGHLHKHHHDAWVAAIDLNIDQLKMVSQEEGWPKDKIEIFQHDIRDSQGWRDLTNSIVKHKNAIDYLFNIAGYLLPGNLIECSEDAINKHIDINIKGTIHGSLIVGREMAKQNKGHIINLGSLSSIAPIPGISLYSTTKFAIRSFSLCLAQELKSHGVTVSLVNPDAVESPMLEMQKKYPQAALTFSGKRAISMREMLDHLLWVMKKKPLESSLPRQRAFLAHITSFFPSLGFLLGPLMAKKGRAKQLKD